MSTGPGFVAAVAVAGLIMALGIVDVLRVGRRRFAEAGRRRADWILLIVFFGPLAVLLYAAAVRPQVVHPQRYADEVAEESAAEGHPTEGATVQGTLRGTFAPGERAS